MTTIQRVASCCLAGLALLLAGGESRGADVMQKYNFKYESILPNNPSADELFLVVTNGEIRDAAGQTTRFQNGQIGPNGEWLRYTNGLVPHLATEQVRAKLRKAQGAVREPVLGGFFRRNGQTASAVLAGTTMALENLELAPMGLGHTVEFDLLNPFPNALGGWATVYVNNGFLTGYTLDSFDVLRGATVAHSFPTLSSMGPNGALDLFVSVSSPDQYVLIVGQIDVGNGLEDFALGIIPAPGTAGAFGLGALLLAGRRRP